MSRHAVVLGLALGAVALSGACKRAPQQDTLSQFHVPPGATLKMTHAVDVQVSAGAGSLKGERGVVQLARDGGPLVVSGRVEAGKLARYHLSLPSGEQTLVATVIAPDGTKTSQRLTIQDGAASARFE